MPALGPGSLFYLPQPNAASSRLGTRQCLWRKRWPARLCPATRPSSHPWGPHLLPSVPSPGSMACSRPPPPSTDSKLCREKYNTRDDSGWQINKLALITIRVSNPYFSQARQWWLLSRFGPPMPPGPRDLLAAWQGPAGGHRAQQPAPNLPARAEGLCEASGLAHPKNAFEGTTVVHRMLCQSFTEAPVPGLGKQQPSGLTDVRFLPGGLQGNSSVEEGKKKKKDI